MDAWLATVAVILVMIVAMVLLARSWPRSSRSGGYRAGRGAGHGSSADGGAEPAPAEDDDTRWEWPAGDGPGQRGP